MVCEFIYSVCVLCLCRETNMKVRQSLSVTAELGDPNNLASFDGEVVCEPPNNKLDRFCGLLCWRDCKYPLSNHNMLLRGCVLRNTETCYGLVIFAGWSFCVCLCVCVCVCVYVSVSLSVCLSVFV
uniref:ATPase phospholipid transporting 8B2 n=1 Tax=Hucho hucho TaxID=62062 RepID=A0A4W5MCV4_9TELE